VERLGRCLAYPYLLRVPLLVWLLLFSFPWVAVPTRAPFGALLRGIFDIGGASATMSLLAYSLVTLASLMTAMSVAVTARLILLDGHERFGAARVPRRPGARLLFRVVALLLMPASIVVAICWEAHVSRSDVSPFTELFGIAIGIVAFVLVTLLNDELWASVVEGRRALVDSLLDFLEGRPSSPAAVVALAAKVASLLHGAGPLTNVRVLRAMWWLMKMLAKGAIASANWVARFSPSGYVESDTGDLRARHKFAAIQCLLSFIFYCVLGLIKAAPNRANEAPYVPTLCLILVITMLACWALSAVTFFFDRFRVPLLLVVGCYAWVSSRFPESDHFYTTTAVAPRAEAPTPAEVLRRREGKPVILVAASGGGIQAEAWTARVLAGLKHDFDAHGLDFDRSLVLLSSVSGGSVGSMFFVDAYQDDGTLPAVNELDDYGPVKEAETATLDEITWGLVYPDVLWALFPFLKGVSFHPFTLLDGTNLTSDRGSALENAWRLSPTLERATLSGWESRAREGKQPFVIFNATIVETGQRMLLSTSSMGRAPGGAVGPTVGRRAFQDLYPERDIPVVTAARLSAAFPWVTPAARVSRGDVFASDYHVVDGGYYDNYGVATLIEWLNNGLRAGALPKRVLIVQIRAEPADDDERTRHDAGWFFQLEAPLETLESVRGTAQFSRNQVAMGFVCRKATGQEAGEYRMPVETFEFEFDGAASDDTSDPSREHSEPGDKVQIPLSWHLTAAEKMGLKREWEHGQRIQVERERLWTEFAR
jgi:hypothetical protein